MPLSTITAIVSLVVKKLKQSAKFVQDNTKSKKTRTTRRVLLKNIFFAMSSNRWKMLFTVNIGRKRLDSHTPCRYLYTLKLQIVTSHRPIG